MKWGVSDLAVDVGGRRALEGVNLTADLGRVTAVVGGDGAGKTTLLRVLAGLLRPASGQVRRPPLREIGVATETAGGYADLTVDENLAFAAAARDLTDGRWHDRAASLVDRAGLTEARGRLASQLSGGMRKKLGVITALLHAPWLVVLDEPTTGVDPVSRAELWRLVTHAAAEGAAVVLSTTYLDEAERADHVLVLDQGEPLVTGEPGAVVAGLGGALYASASPPDGGQTAWRRGRTWRVWHPHDDGGGAEAVPPDGEPVRARLEDVVIAAQLRREGR